MEELNLSGTGSGTPNGMDLDPKAPVDVAAEPPCAMDQDHELPEPKSKPARTLAEAQHTLAGIANGRLVIVPGDGSCFFHVIAAGTSGAKTVKELRQSSGCPGDDWAEVEKFRLVVWRIDLTDPTITVPCMPFQRLGARKAKEAVHTIYWTRDGRGLHFDLWKPTGGQPKAGDPRGTDQKGSANGGASTKGPGVGHPPGERVFCPIQECPCANAKRAAGWTDLAAMRPHLPNTRTAN